MTAEKKGQGKKCPIEKMFDWKKAKGKNNNTKSNFSTIANFFVKIFSCAFWIKSSNQFYRNHLIEQPANPSLFSSAIFSRYQKNVYKKTFIIILFTK